LQKRRALPAFGWTDRFPRPPLAELVEEEGRKKEGGGRKTVRRERGEERWERGERREERKKRGERRGERGNQCISGSGPIKCLEREETEEWKGEGGINASLEVGLYSALKERKRKNGK
jgi:hypothetical protein